MDSEEIDCPKICWHIKAKETQLNIENAIVYNVQLFAIHINIFFSFPACTLYMNVCYVGGRDVVYILKIVFYNYIVYVTV